MKAMCSCYSDADNMVNHCLGLGKYLQLATSVTSFNRGTLFLFEADPTFLFNSSMSHAPVLYDRWGDNKNAWQ